VLTPPKGRCEMPVVRGDGWPSQVRAVDVPASQDVPARDRDCGLALSLAYQACTSLEGVSQRDFTAAASDAEGCGPDSQWPIQSAASQ